MRCLLVASVLAYVTLVATTPSAAQPVPGATGEPDTNPIDEPQPPTTSTTSATDADGTPGQSEPAADPPITEPGSNSETSGTAAPSATTGETPTTGPAPAGKTAPTDKPIPDCKPDSTKGATGPGGAKGPGGPPSAKQALRNWWQRSSKSYDKPYPGFLYRIEGQYSYMLARGNVETNNHLGRLMVVLRKGNLSSQSSYLLNLSKTTLKPAAIQSTVEQAVQQANQLFYYDIHKLLAVEVGASWTTNLTSFIDNRFTYYAGVSSHVITDRKFQLKLGVYGGYETTSFDNAYLQTVSGMPDLVIPESRSRGLLFTQQFNWLINRALKFQESATYLQNLEDRSLYRWTVDGALNFMVGPAFAFVNSVSIVYDKNRIVQNPVEALIGYGARDIRMTLGVKLAL